MIRLDKNYPHRKRRFVIVGLGAAFLAITVIFVFQFAIFVIENGNEQEKATRTLKTALLLDADSLREIIAVEEFARTPNAYYARRVHEIRIIVEQHIAELKERERLSGVIQSLVAYEVARRERHKIEDDVIRISNFGVSSENIEALLATRNVFKGREIEYLETVVEIEKAIFEWNSVRSAYERLRAQKSAVVFLGFIIVAVMFFASIAPKERVN